MTRRARLVFLAAWLALAACATPQARRGAIFHPSDAGLAVTRVVHGTFILELRGTRVLVDPWFHSGYLTRHGEPLGLTPARLPGLAAILITSDAPDHYDGRALGDLAGTVPRAVAPPALRPALLRLGFREVIALGWWQAATIEGVTVTAVPTSGGPRTNGYVVASADTRLYVAGTTAAFPKLADIVRALGPLDLALLPVGGPPEMTPEQAAQAAVTLDAARVVPSAYGTSGGPFTPDAADMLARFRTAMTAQHLASRIVVLESGESWHYAKR